MVCMYAAGMLVRNRTFSREKEKSMIFGSWGGGRTTAVKGRAGDGQRLVVFDSFRRSRDGGRSLEDRGWTHSGDILELWPENGGVRRRRRRERRRGGGEETLEVEEVRDEVVRGLLEIVSS